MVSAKLGDCNWFEKNRLEQWKAAKDIDEHFHQGDYYVKFKAPVKSGKREVEEALAVLSGHTSQRIIHVTALNRTDIHSQFEELEGYGIKCVTLKNEDDVNDCLQQIANELKNNSVMLIIDEADFASGKEQLLDSIFSFALDLKTPGQIKILLITATMQEIDVGYITESWPTVELHPHPTYRGVNWFLEQNLVEDAMEFFTLDSKNKVILSSQGKEAIQLLSSSDKNFGIVRAASGNFGAVCASKRGEKLYQKLKKMHKKGELLSVINDVASNVTDIQFVDADDKFKWGEKGDWKRFLPTDEEITGKVLIIINQTCTRSTEVKFRKHIAFWHDYRKGGTPARKSGTPQTTLLQAIGRVFHYHESGHHIRVYADSEVFKIEAKIISQSSATRPLSGRTQQNSGLEWKKIVIKHGATLTNDEISDRVKRECELVKITSRRGYNCSSRMHISKWQSKDIITEYLFGDKGNSRLMGDSNHSLEMIVLDGPNRKFLESWENLIEQGLNTKGDLEPGDVVVLVPYDNLRFVAKNSIYAPNNEQTC